MSGFTQNRRHDLEHIAHHGGDVDEIMNASTMPAARIPMPLTAPPKQPATERHATQHFLQRHLHEIGKYRREHEQAEHAIDDGRDGRQQLHRRTERAAQPHGAGFCQEQCNAKCQRHGNQQCNPRAGDGADDGDRRTKFFIDDVPLSAPDELDAKLVESWPRVNEQRDDDAQQRRSTSSDLGSGSADGKRCPAAAAAWQSTPWTVWGRPSS